MHWVTAPWISRNLETSVQSRVPARICGRSTHSHVSRDRPGERPPQAARRMWLCKGQLASHQWGGSGAWVSRDLEYRVRPLLPGFASLYSKSLETQGPMTPRVYAFSSPCIDASDALFMPGHSAVDLEKLGNQRTKQGRAGQGRAGEGRAGKVSRDPSP